MKQLVFRIFEPMRERGFHPQTMAKIFAPQGMWSVPRTTQSSRLQRRRQPPALVGMVMASWRRRTFRRASEDAEGFHEDRFGGEQEFWEGETSQALPESLSSAEWRYR